MKFILFLFLQMTAASADPVPRCWSADQPNIQNGIFRVFVSTRNTESRDVARVLGLLAQSLAVQDGVGTSNDLSRIEIDMLGELKYWEPSSLFPTLDSFKTAIVHSLTPVLEVQGVRIECSRIVDRHLPNP